MKPKHKYQQALGAAAHSTKALAYVTQANKHLVAGFGSISTVAKLCFGMDLDRVQALSSRENRPANEFTQLQSLLEACLPEDALVLFPNIVVPPGMILTKMQQGGGDLGHIESHLKAVLRIDRCFVLYKITQKTSKKVVHFFGTYEVRGQRPTGGEIQKMILMLEKHDLMTGLDSQTKLLDETVRKRQLVAREHAVTTEEVERKKKKLEEMDEEIAQYRVTKEEADRKVTEIAMTKEDSEYLEKNRQLLQWFSPIADGGHPTGKDEEEKRTKRSLIWRDSTMEKIYINTRRSPDVSTHAYHLTIVNIMSVLQMLITCETNKNIQEIRTALAQVGTAG